MRIIVVVAVREPNHRTQTCIAACARLTYEPRVVAVVTDAPLALPDDSHFTNVVTGASYVTAPGTKRQLAAAACDAADVYAYLDDDAYPPQDWLERAAGVLREFPEAAGAAGPERAPDDESFWECVSSAVMESWLGSGSLRYRSSPQRARWCDHYPSFNLFVRKQWLMDAGGWNDWVVGEDTELGYRVARRGGLIRYDPRLAVYHYRRPPVPHHWRQMSGVGEARGCFLREGEPRARRLTFAGPPLFVAAALVLGTLPFVMGPAWLLGAGACALTYASLALFGAQRGAGWRVRLVLPAAFVIHHAAYTWGLLLGLVRGRRVIARPAPSSSSRSATARSSQAPIEGSIRRT